MIVPRTIDGQLLGLRCQRMNHLLLCSVYDILNWMGECQDHLDLHKRNTHPQRKGPFVFMSFDPDLVRATVCGR